MLALMAGCTSHPDARANGGSSAPATSVSAPTSPGPSLPPNALAACEAVLGPNVATASATTIGDLRAYNYGPAIPATGTAPATGIQPGKNGFPGDAPDDFGAWCATGHAGDWVTWGVDAHGQSLRMVEIVGAITAPPTGGPEIP